MKELFELLAKDIKTEDFSRKECVIYGIFAPLAMVAVCVLAEIISSL